MNNVSQGDVLAGRYRLIAPLGHGGMAVVYKAIDQALERLVAIKIIPSEGAAGVGRRPFAEEAKTLALLSHPNVIAVYDVGAASDCSYLVTEFIQGRSLAEILRDGEPLDPNDALAIIAQVGHALAYSRRCCHRWSVSRSPAVVSQPAWSAATTMTYSR
jgi:eukaryotic-like serine/threonine-protein kinase